MLTSAVQLACSTFFSFLPNIQSVNKDNDEHYRYKAKKYHYKIQQKLKEMQTQGKAIPQGYEQYLKPFSA